MCAPPGIHPRLKQPVGQRLALGALHAAYGKGSGAVGGVIQGCALGTDDAAEPKLTLSFDMKGRCVLLVVLELVSPVQVNYRSMSRGQIMVVWWVQVAQHPQLQPVQPRALGDRCALQRVRHGAVGRRPHQRRH